MLRKRIRIWLLGMVAALAALAPHASAQVGSDRYSSIVIDANSGTVLSAANPDERRFPASLTKMMTIYMLFEALRDRRLGLNQTVPVSSYAASMSPTKLGLLPGTYITVEQALLGLVTKSANDAAAALGEMLGGDEDRFAQMMTLRARALGMTNTTFRNASGLPDWNQVTTARDMAVLGLRLVQDFPAYYHYFSVPSFVFQGRTIVNHQRLLQSYPGADGLKTGYITASGFNVVTSALRGNTRLVGVVMGGASGWERDEHMAELLDQGFERTGAPTLVAGREAPAFRLPFIGTAHAASQPYALRTAPIVLRPMQFADIRPQAPPPELFRRMVRVEPARRAEPAQVRRVAARPELRGTRMARFEPPAARLAPTAIRANPQAARARLPEPPRPTRGITRTAGGAARTRG